MFLPKSIDFIPSAGIRTFSNCPVRICSNHFGCRDTPATRIARAALNLAFVNTGMARFKAHMGTYTVCVPCHSESFRCIRLIPSSVPFEGSGEDTEVQYQLMGYGIPITLLPMTEAGDVKTKPVLQWIKVRKEIENGVRSNEQQLPIECPGLNDVVFRLGGAYLSHPGNFFFREIVESFYDEHVSTQSRGQKVRITWQMVQMVEAKGGRFLMWNKGGWWTVMDDKNEIRVKVASAIKEYAKRVKANQNQQANASSTYKFGVQDMRKRKRDDSCDEAGQCGCGF
jgi:hypothetical protein